MIRFFLFSFFGLLLAGCVKPVQMEIPKTHPANPEASAAPAVVQNDYIFHLPDDKLPEKSISAESGHAHGTGHHEDSTKNHTGHESMSPEKTGGEHAH